MLKASLMKLQQGISVTEQKYEELNQHIEKQLQTASSQVAKEHQHFQKEIDELTSKLQTAEIRSKTTKDKLATKQRENDDLHAVCDDIFVRFVQV